VILVDLNVVLDVLQARQPHYGHSAELLDRVIKRRVSACVSAHAVTTVHYLVQRYQNKVTANDTVDLLLRYFTVIATGREQLLRARSLQFSDFEDAVVAAAAESARCLFIVSRNVKDFKDSPVPAITPPEFLVLEGQ
jgi:predicted nucleic acid-binding protein